MPLYGYIVVILACICCTYACHVIHKLKKEMDDNLIFVMHHVYELQKVSKILMEAYPQLKERAEVEKELEDGKK